MPTILIIEDEPDQNKLIRLRLEARGYRVISVAKAKEGIDAARQAKPDLILLDMILPDMHGLDAAIKLKQMPETTSIPIVAISAVGSPDFIKVCLQEGIAAYVRKPYEPRELFKIIEKNVRSGAPREKKEESRKRTSPAGKGVKSYEEELERIVLEFKKKASRPKEKRAEMGPSTAPGSAPGVKLEDSLFEPPPKSASPEPKAKSILIIDDDPAFVRAVTNHLAENGYEVAVALDGLGGLKMAFEKKPDLILLNLVLPAGGGEAVLTNLRKSSETASLPVFLMSSLLSAKNLEDKSRELGAQGFIAKPIEPQDLLFIIESVVGR